MVEHNKTLNLGSCQETSDGDSALPPKRKQPTDSEGQELLRALRCELGNPVVLATCTSVSRREKCSQEAPGRSTGGWGHRGHFGHRNIDQREEEDDDDVQVD
jgi:hypothetical protein